MAGVQMGEEDGGDIRRRDTGSSQRTGQQPCSRPSSCRERTGRDGGAVASYVY